MPDAPILVPLPDLARIDLANLCPSPNECIRPDVLWRTTHPNNFTGADCDAIRRFLARTTIDHPRWVGAQAGVAADAVALVVAERPIAKTNARIDALMTALLYATLSDENKAAELTIFHTLAQLGHRSIRSCAGLAASWNLKLRHDDYERRIRHPYPLRRILPEEQREHTLALPLAA
jgi:hypothetical protein